jgi:hypothetical protein
VVTEVSVLGQTRTDPPCPGGHSRSRSALEIRRAAQTWGAATPNPGPRNQPGRRQAAPYLTAPGRIAGLLTVLPSRAAWLRSSAG